VAEDLRLKNWPNKPGAQGLASETWESNTAAPPLCALIPHFDAKWISETREPCIKPVNCFAMYVSRP
jgi:hypothetical protein